MNMVRGILAVVVGYLLLAGVSMGVVASLFGQTQEPETKATVFAIAGLALGAIIAGFVCTLITGSANHPAIYITLGVLLVMTARTYYMGGGVEPDWYRVVGTLAQAIGFLVGASASANRFER